MPTDKRINVLESSGDRVSSALEVALYLNKYEHNIDEQRFAYVSYYGKVKKVQNDYGKERLNWHVMWIKRWSHWSFQGMLNCRESGTWTDMVLVRCHEEAGYEEWLTTLVRVLMDTERNEVLYMTALSEVHPSKLVLDETYDANWFCSNRKYWEKDQELRCKCGVERQMCWFFWMEQSREPWGVGELSRIFLRRGLELLGELGNFPPSGSAEDTIFRLLFTSGPWVCTG